MITLLCRVRCLSVVAVVAYVWAVGTASAQPPGDPPEATKPWSVLTSRVPAGDVVYVTDATGATVEGKLAAMTDQAIRVIIGAGMMSISMEQVRRIQWEQRDSPLTGVLIGAAVGAIPGIYWLAADPNECAGMCPEEYGLIAVGAAVGGVIDLAIKRRVTVYAAEGSSSRAKRITIGPVASRHRRGVRVAVTF